MKEITSVCVICGATYNSDRGGPAGRPAVTCSPECRRRRRNQINQNAKAKRPAAACVHPDGCSRPQVAGGWCDLHYRRVHQYGDPGPAERIVAAKGTPGLTQFGYVRVERKFQHRIVMEQILGRPMLPSENVHHINGDRTDNRPENLELWSKTQPAGQRVADKVAWAIELLALYQPEVLVPPKGI